jgi:hypothetical protein
MSIVMVVAPNPEQEMSKNAPGRKHADQQVDTISRVGILRGSSGSGSSLPLVLQ